MKHIIYKLAKRYPQLYLPIEEGISKGEEYKNVCLRGMKSNRELLFSFNDKDSLETFKTSVGDVEIITLYERSDFVHAAICLGNKCEPEDIKDSTGAMTIFGLNNWDKVNAGLKNYKDSLILLSSGNYSNVSLNDINHYCHLSLSKDEWIEKSIIIRKYHELTHFIMRKKYPDNISVVRDELIADGLGIIAAFGVFNKEMLKLFLGLENQEYRKGGRLENYHGDNDIVGVTKLIDELELKLNINKDINYFWEHVNELM